MQPEIVANYSCHTGEGPRWHPGHQAVYWLDIPLGRIYRFFPASGQHEQVFQGPVVGAMEIQEDGSLLLFMENGRISIWEDGALRDVTREIPEVVGTRFNDSLVDPSGRVFAGTMPSESQQSCLFRIDCDRSIHVVIPDVGQSNGMALSPDLRWLYHTDTRRKTIRRYLYSADGSVGEGETIVTVHETNAVPDGLAVDAQGFLWSAHWGGSCLVRYTPEGSEDARIELPTPNVSCATFGGPDYSDLYITTAGGDDPSKNGPNAGALFRVRPPVAGPPLHRSRVGLH